MSNSFVKQFLEKASEHFSLDSAGMTTSQWIEANTTLKKRAFSFSDYEFQRQIVDDMHPNLSVIKISQIGLTEIQIRKALSFLKRNQGTSLIFSLPNEAMFERISKGRVKPIVNADPVFTTPSDLANKATRSTEIMQFGSSFLYLVPATESAATSIAADFVMNDEVDISDQKMITLFNSRLQGSKHKISQKFSTPTFPSFGIDLSWQSSDQHHYMCLCRFCGHWNYPEFNRDFIHIPGMPDVAELTEITQMYKDTMELHNAYVMCEKCHEPLDLRDPKLRQWVAKHPNRLDSRGYRINPFTVPHMDLNYIFRSMWAYQDTQYMRGFYNTVLGLPYSDGNMQIPLEDIRACITETSLMPNLEKVDNLWVGIDVGQTCHITYGSGTSEHDMKQIGLAEMHVDRIVQHAAWLEANCNLRGGCIDRHPYEPTARDVFNASGRKIIPTEYRGQKDINIVENELGELAHAQVNHTWFLDNYASLIRKRKLEISGYGHYKQILEEHLRDMVREENQTKPGAVAQWIKLHGNDHFFHSSAFMVLGPRVKNFVLLKSGADMRTLAISTVMSIGNPKQGNGNLIGFGTNERISGKILGND